jgi:hypothetical protein
MMKYKRSPCRNAGAFLLPRRKPMKLMKRFTGCLAMAIALCLSIAFPISAAAEGLTRVAAYAVDLAGDQGAKLARHELTLAMWRGGDGDAAGELKSNLLASSNHFVQVSATGEPASTTIALC